MRTPKKILAAVSLSLTLSCTTAAPVVLHTTVVEAHSGRTDGSGGHHDNRNASGLGSYHYHCGGHPAHLHTGGVCPYSSDTAVAVQTAGSDGQTDVSSDSLAASGTDTGSSLSVTGKGKLTLSSGESIDISADVVKLIQEILNQKGYDCGTVDGILGEKSKEAIKKFLEDNDNSTDNMIISMVAEGLGLK
ncbi:MAG: YHYH domain-containing protein [Eubacteriales bacterium]|nr:YHYH domain-containing protein [Eubacteriales bacterium]